MPDDASRDTAALKLALGQARRKRVELFCDFTGQACIRFLTGRRVQTVPIRSTRCRSWVAGLCWRSHGVLPLDREIDRVLNVLEDLAWGADRNEAADSRIADVLDQEPVLQAVVEYMRDRPEYSSLMSPFLDDLTRHAAKKGIQVHAKRWPKSAAALSFKLNANHDILGQLRIGLRIDHTRDGSKVTLTPLTPGVAGDAPTSRASHGASREKPGGGGGSSPGDAVTPADRVAELKAQLNQLKGDVP